MQKTVVLFIVFICFVLKADAQLSEKHYMRKNFHLYADTCIIDIVIIEEDLEIKTKSHLDYYWYKNRHVYKNEGGYGGYLLDGTYKCFTLRNQLITEGFFIKGLKHGTWKTWDLNGKLMSQVVYENGLLHGDSILYDINGEVSKVYYKAGVVSTKKGLFFKADKKDKVDIQEDADIEISREEEELIEPIDTIIQVNEESDLDIKAKDEENSIVQPEMKEEKSNRRRRAVEPKNKKIETEQN